MCEYKTVNMAKDELLACRGCLSTDVILYDMHQHQLMEPFMRLVGASVLDSDIVPQHLCCMCGALLIKYNTFREQCLNAQMLFEELQGHNKMITTDSINNTNIKPFKTYKLTQTAIDIVDLSQKNIEITFTEVLVNDNHKDVETDIKPIEIEVVKCESPQEVSIKIENVDGLMDDSESSDEFIADDTPSYSKRPRRKVKDIIKPNIKKAKKSKDVKKEKDRKGKFFETKEGINSFEEDFDVDICVLTKEQQMEDVQDRKKSLNYISGPYRCEECFKGFMNEDNLSKHYSTQHDPSRGDVICEFCRFRYKDRRGLNQHLKSHRLKFTCKQCKYVSRTTFNAKEHYKMHGGQMHECKYCGKAYEKLTSHLTHMRLHHPSELIWCELCGEPFIGDFGLNGHKKQAHRDLKLHHKCQKCGAQFTNTVALQRHATESHDCDASVAKRSCAHCGTVHLTTLALRDHLLQEHRVVKKHHCEKCNKTFAKESLYSAHYRRMHVETAHLRRNSQKPWVCEVCGKSLPSKCLLVYHQRNHTGERPYPCTQCPKSFTMRKLLQSHMRVHTSDRPFICKLCPKTFKGLSALRGHEQVHTGAKIKPTPRTTRY